MVWPDTGNFMHQLWTWVMFMIMTILFSTIIKGIRDILNSARPKTVIFPPATSGMSPMSGIYASLRQAELRGFAPIGMLE